MSIERPAQNNREHTWPQLESALSAADRVIAGELTFSDTIRGNLVELIESDQASGLEPSRAAHVRELIHTLPRAEILNCLQRAEAADAEGDHTQTVLWRDEGLRRLKRHAELGTVATEEAEELEGQLRRLAAPPLS